MPKLVYIACPVRGKTEDEVQLYAAYRRACHRHSILNDETPFPWSGYLELFDDPSDPVGMSLYKDWIVAAMKGVMASNSPDIFSKNDSSIKLVVYCDFGVSAGMMAEIEFFSTLNIKVERRLIEEIKHAVRRS